MITKILNWLQHRRDARMNADKVRQAVKDKVITPTSDEITKLVNELGVTETEAIDYLTSEKKKQVRNGKIKAFQDKIHKFNEQQAKLKEKETSTKTEYKPTSPFSESIIDKIENRRRN